MGLTKTEGFEAVEIEGAGLFKALAHPARMAIVRFLLETKTCMTGEIAEKIPLSPTTVGQHLRELKKAGLIKGVIEGPAVKYCVNPEGVSRLTEALNILLENYDSTQKNS